MALSAIQRISAQNGCLSATSLNGAATQPIMWKRYAAPASANELLAWLPLMPVALLSSKWAPIATVSRSMATAAPNSSLAWVLEALTYKAGHQYVPLLRKT